MEEEEKKERRKVEIERWRFLVLCGVESKSMKKETFGRGLTKEKKNKEIDRTSSAGREER